MRNPPTICPPGREPAWRPCPRPTLATCIGGSGRCQDSRSPPPSGLLASACSGWSDDGGTQQRCAHFVPDCVVLVKLPLGDERVSRWRKLILLPLLAYLALPIDLVPDFVPVAGQLDDAIVIGLALCVVLRGGDRALLRAHWPGPPESLAVVERFAFGAPRYAGARRERLTDEYRTQNRSVGTDPGSTHPSGRERETRSLSRIPVTRPRSSVDRAAAF